MAEEDRAPPARGKEVVPGREEVPEELRSRRDAMLERDLLDRGISDPEVMRAMARVRRDRFLPADLRIHSFDDTPLRIGCGQTISQPYIVAYMTEALEVEAGMKVLEIGTGSGYQAAVLAEMGAEVFSIERFEDLSYAAEAVLDELGYGENVTLRVDDGTLGWPEEAPFPRIIVTAAGPRVPEALAGQLAEGGRMVIPVGEVRGEQHLLLVTKEEGKLLERELLEVRFVPLMGREGY